MVVHWHCRQSSRNVSTERERERGGEEGGEKGVHRVSIKESATVEEGQEGADKGLARSPLFRAFDLVFFFVYRG